MKGKYYYVITFLIEYMNTIKLKILFQSKNWPLLKKKTMSIYKGLAMVMDYLRGKKTNIDFIENIQLGKYLQMLKNKTNHPTSRNSHLRWPQMKQYTSKKEEGVGIQNQQEHHIILTKYEAVHPTVVSENDSSSGMLII